MTHRTQEIIQDLLNALHLAAAESVSKMYSREDMSELTAACDALSKAGYELTIEELPHSGYLSIRIKRTVPVVTGNHICCPCVAK